MSMITKSVDFTRTQKSRYLKKETLLFLQIIIFLKLYTSMVTLLQEIAL